MEIKFLSRLIKYFESHKSLDRPMMNYQRQRETKWKKTQQDRWKCPSTSPVFHFSRTAKNYRLFVQQIMRLCSLRTVYYPANWRICIMHFLVTIDFHRYVSGKARSYATRRGKTYCGRDRFAAIKHGMRLSLCKFRSLRPAMPLERFITADTVSPVIVGARARF